MRYSKVSRLDNEDRKYGVLTRHCVGCVFQSPLFILPHISNRMELIVTISFQAHDYITQIVLQRISLRRTFSKCPDVL